MPDAVSTTTRRKQMARSSRFDPPRQTEIRPGARELPKNGVVHYGQLKTAVLG